MLRTMKDLEGYTIGATDGIIGEVKDFYFDDHVWAIRYLVVDTGESPAPRKVLISPIAIAQPNLRSGNAVMRYYVNASDGDVGHVDGLLVDERSWAIRYVVVNTSNWWVGHKVLIATRWIDYVNWAESKIDVNLTRQAIKDSPPYDAATSFTPEREAGIHAHYGRVGYWPRDAKDAETDSRA
jgi:hypothetical protein